ncbi:MAG: hypothetical protein KGP28_07570 [Bdellovibrionales bacterium]|nr:hypothetical protein [Bdellovibrionales bacterium]
MAESRRFSEVGIAYNDNVFSLDEARGIFEKEISQLNKITMDHLFTASKRLNQEDRYSKKFRWQDPEDDSRDRDGPWLNFTSRASIGIDIKTPGSKVFRKNVAYLYFETVFDWDDKKKFIFQCRLENQNLVSGDLDERVFEEVQKASDKFPGHIHYKANTTILFRLPINEALFDSLNQQVDNSLDICLKVFEKIFSDEMYRNEKAE